MKLKSIEAKPDFKVREDWDTLRFWQVVDLRSQKNRPDMQLLSVFLNRGVIRYGEGGGQVHKPGRDLSVYQVVREGDLVMNNQQAWRGSVGVSRYDGIISPAYLVLRLRSCLLPRFGDYLFQSRPMVDQWVTSSKGVGDIQRDIFVPWLKQAKVPIPTKDEQALIIRFLDWASVRLGKAIAAKRKVIGLFEEQKQAIIHRAVTRGLDDTVPLKPSGLDWLGEVPEHWEINRIKNEFVCLNRRRIPLSAPERGRMKNQTYDYYGASGVIDKVQDYIFDEDLLLIAEDGANLVLRNLPLAIIARGKYWVNNHAHILRPRFGSLEFFAHAVERLNFQPWITGAAQPKLTKDRLLSVELSVPPEREQRQIVDFIDTATKPLVAAIGIQKREITLLREYQTRLISDVVTGKLDVREFAKSLPDDVSEEAAELAATETLDEDFATDDELIEEAV